MIYKSHEYKAPASYDNSLPVIITYSNDLSSTHINNLYISSVYGDLPVVVEFEECKATVNDKLSAKQACSSFTSFKQLQTIHIFDCKGANIKCVQFCVRFSYLVYNCNFCSINYPLLDGVNYDPDPDKYYGVEYYELDHFYQNFLSGYDSYQHEKLLWKDSNNEIKKEIEIIESILKAGNINNSFVELHRNDYFGNNEFFSHENDFEVLDYELLPITLIESALDNENVNELNDIEESPLRLVEIITNNKNSSNNINQASIIYDSSQTNQIEKSTFIKKTSRKTKKKQRRLNGNINNNCQNNHR